MKLAGATFLVAGGNHWPPALSNNPVSVIGTPQKTKLLLKGKALDLDHLMEK